MNPSIFYNFGFVPAAFFSDYSSLTIYTSMFLHGGFFHIAGNMLYLWIFGDNVEDAMGTLKFIIFYLLCGTIAALCQGFVDPNSQIPMVGASGAIAGVLGAYLMLYPKANVKCLIFIIIIIQMIRIPAFIVLGFWLALQFFNIPGSIDSDGGTAYFAHIGGFLAGIVLIPFFKNKNVQLFHEKNTSSWQVFERGSNEFNFKKNNDVVIDFIKKSEESINRRKH
jgi:membrane associated rhomboid family serine protease